MPRVPASSRDDWRRLRGRGSSLSWPVLHRESSFILRIERSPCSQSAWRALTDEAADPFWRDHGCSGFRAQFAPERDCFGRQDFTSPGDGTRPMQRTFTVFTSKANRLTEPIHERMLAILDERAGENWMNPGEQDGLRLKSLLVPARTIPSSSVPDHHS